MLFHEGKLNTYTNRGEDGNSEFHYALSRNNTGTNCSPVAPVSGARALPDLYSQQYPEVIK